MTTPPQDEWTRFAHELATMPDVVERLLADHVPNAGNRCVRCTAPGRGTPHLRWPCPLWGLARRAQAFRATWRAAPPDVMRR